MMSKMQVALFVLFFIEGFGQIPGVAGIHGGKSFFWLFVSGFIAVCVSHLPTLP